MTRPYFFSQMNRIRNVFGKGNYPLERTNQIWAVVKDLPDHCFLNIVNYFIGNRRVEFPPMADHFREQAHHERQAIFREKTQRAFNQLDQKARETSPDGLKKTLEQMGVNSLLEAIQKKKQTGGEQ